MSGVEELAKRINYPIYRQALGKPADLYQALAVTALVFAVSALVDTMIGLTVELFTVDVRQSVKAREVLSGFNFIYNWIMSYRKRGILDVEKGVRSSGTLKMSKRRVALGFIFLVFAVGVEVAAILGGLPSEKEVVEAGTLLRLNFAPGFGRGTTGYEPTANLCDSVTLDGDVRLKNIEVCNIKSTLTGARLTEFDGVLNLNSDASVIIGVHISAKGYAMFVRDPSRLDIEIMAIIATDTEGSKYQFTWPEASNELQPLYVAFKKVVRQEFPDCEIVDRRESTETTKAIASGALSSGCSNMEPNLLFERIRKEMRRGLAISEYRSPSYAQLGPSSALDSIINPNSNEPLRDTIGEVNVALVTGYKMNAFVILPIAVILYVFNILLLRFDSSSDDALFAVNAHYERGGLSDAFHDVVEETRQQLVKSSEESKQPMGHWHCILAADRILPQGEYD